MLCRCGNLSGKLQWNDNQELTAIGAHDQHVGARVFQRAAGRR
jgi:hypothetical protein